MPKTPDEIKKGLWCCTQNSGCDVCPYRVISVGCRPARNADALDLILQLESDKQQLEGLLTHMNQLLDAAAGRALKMEERVRQLEAERDAAVRDCGCFPCQTCEERENGDLCRMCEIEGGYRSFHQWRGVQKEDK